MRPIDREFEKLKSKLLEIANLSIELVELVTTEIPQTDVLRDKVEKSMSLRRSVHEHSIEIIARFQPTASDLKFLITALEISYGLYRLSRYAFDIATLFGIIERGLGVRCPLPISSSIKSNVLKMVKLSVTAYMERKYDLASEVVEMDEDIDNALRRSIDSVVAGRGDICTFMDLIMAIYLERMADHSVYIAKDAIFMKQ